MSLDIHIEVQGPACVCDGKCPSCPSRESIEVWSGNITHNLNTMAGCVGIYLPIWRPEEVGIETANQVIDPLKIGIDMLKSNPAFFQRYNPPNGWGKYEDLIEFLEEYLQACIQNPNAKVRVSR